MRMFVIWLRRNKVALGVATGMFALMAAVMAVMIYNDWSVIGDLMSATSGKMSSPFLWVWRVGGLFTWPVFYMLLLRSYAGDGNPRSKGTMAAVVSAGALYGGFGMWGANELAGLLLRSVDGAALRPGMGIEFGILLVIDLISLAYTWGFCVIYALALGRLSGRQGTQWVLPSIGYALLGRWVGSILVSLLLFIVLYIFLLVIMTMSGFDWTLVVVPVAIALSVGNFVGQWPGFWVTHDRALGIVPMPAIPYPSPMAAFPSQGIAPDGTPLMGYPPYPMSPTSAYPGAMTGMAPSQAGTSPVVSAPPAAPMPAEAPAEGALPMDASSYGGGTEPTSQPVGMRGLGE